MFVFQKNSIVYPEKHPSDLYKYETFFLFLQEFLLTPNKLHFTKLAFSRSEYKNGKYISIKQKEQCCKTVST